MVKTRSTRNLLGQLSVLAGLGSLLVTSQPLLAQNSAFTYHGFLTDQGGPANADYDLRFTIYDSASDGSVAAEPVDTDDLRVANGLFTVTLDFGSAVFDGGDRWLEIEVRPGASSGDFTNVVPRQKITATPYAIRAANFSGPVDVSQITGKLTTLHLDDGVVTSDKLAAGAAAASLNAFDQDAVVLDGSGVTNLDAGNLTSGTIPAGRFPAVLPAIDGSQLTGITGGSGNGNSTNNIISGATFVGSSTNAVGAVHTGGWKESGEYLIDGPHYVYHSLLNPNPTPTSANFDFSATPYHMGTTSRSNVAYRMGYNSLREVVGEASFYTVLETHWGLNGGAPNFEWYLETFDTSSGWLRPISVTTAKDYAAATRVDFFGSSVKANAASFGLSDVASANDYFEARPYASGSPLGFVKLRGDFLLQPGVYYSDPSAATVTWYGTNTSISTQMDQRWNGFYLTCGGSTAFPIVLSGYTGIQNPGTNWANYGVFSNSITAGTTITASGVTIRSNSWVGIPTLEEGDVWLGSSNGILHSISLVGGTYTTNRLVQ